MKAITGCRREELQLVAVGILKIEGRARHPVVENRAPGGHAAFTERRGSLLQIRPADCESEMVARELAVVLLKDDHPGGTTGSKEQPLSLIVPKADFQP